MKKKLFILFLFICFSIVFVACKNSPKKTEKGFFYSFEDCKKSAQRKNKDFLVIFTSDDENSVAFNKSLLESDDFLSVIFDTFEVVHFNFSKTTFENAEIKTYFSKQQKKDAENLQKIINEGNSIVRKVRCQATPSIYRFSKNGFLICEVVLENSEYNSQNLLNNLSLSDSYSNEISEKYQKIKKLTGIEKVRKIDEFYSTFSMEQAFFAEPLIKDVLKFDKNNESGLHSKYLLQNVQIKASNLLGEKRFKDISDEYLKLLENPIFTTDEKINLYFSAALFLGLAENPADIPKIIEYLEAALSLDEKSFYKEDLNDIIEFYKSLLEDNK